MNVFSWLTDTFCSVHEMVFASTRLMRINCGTWNIEKCYSCTHIHMSNMHKYLLHYHFR